MRIFIWFERGSFFLFAMSCAWVLFSSPTSGWVEGENNPTRPPLLHEHLSVHVLDRRNIFIQISVFMNSTNLELLDSEQSGSIFLFLLLHF